MGGAIAMSFGNKIFAPGSATIRWIVFTKIAKMDSNFFFK